MNTEDIQIRLKQQWWWPFVAVDLRDPRDAVVRYRRWSYRVSTRFNWYAQPVAALFVGNFEETALRFYARRAEAQARSGSVSERGNDAIP